MLTPPYNPTHINTYGLGCSRFARRYSGNRENLLPERNGATAPVQELLPELTPKHPSRKKVPTYCFLFLQVLRCFTSLGSLPHTRVTSQHWWGFPIQTLPGRRLIGTSPTLIAAIPRLSSLTLT